MNERGCYTSSPKVGNLMGEGPDEASSFSRRVLSTYDKIITSFTLDLKKSF